MLTWKDVLIAPSPSKQCVLTVLGVSIILFILYSSLFIFTDTHLSHRGIFLPPLPVSYRKEKIVLWWTPFFDKWTDLPLTLSEFGCKFDKCILTSNRSLTNKSSAIIFHWRDTNPSDIPSKNQYATKWVLYNYESPPHSPWRAIEPIITRINWVATYRHDSDLVAPYGAIRRRKLTDIDWNSPDLSQKTFQEKKSVAWLVSNCNTRSRRERYVTNLKKHIPVDIYGQCGSPLKNCVPQPRDSCYKELAKTYKFYLSFENSLYIDYVTEKAFIPLSVGMVPIVLGGANYSRVLPPNSFINAMDFHTPKDLADYLLTVEKNFTLYQTYQKWRKDYIIVYDNIKYFWLCDLCHLLSLHEDYYYDNDDRKKNKQSFYDWWYTKDVLIENNINISF